MEHDGWTFLCGCAPFFNFGFFARERDDIAMQDNTATSFYQWDEEDSSQQWSIYDEVVGWRAQGMATIKPAGTQRLTVALGTRGQYLEIEPQTQSEFTGSIAGYSGLIRRVSAIGDSIVAVGMGRSVIKRLARGRWAEFGPGVTDVDQGNVVGFEDVAGFSEDDIYAVGWRGEVWRWHSGSWSNLDSPTNANLNSVACGSDDDVYIVGDGGVMVRGRQNLWSVVETGRSEDLRDVAVTQDDVFVVTDFRIFRLGIEGLYAEDRFIDGDRPSTCLHLLSANDGVLAMGPKDLFVFHEGTWRRIV